MSVLFLVIFVPALVIFVPEIAFVLGLQMLYSVVRAGYTKVQFKQCWYCFSLFVIVFALVVYLYLYFCIQK